MSGNANLDVNSGTPSFISTSTYPLRLGTSGAASLELMTNGTVRLTIDSSGVISSAAATKIAYASSTIAAAGNSQGTATAITTQFTYVTASDGTKGVILPTTTTAGTMIIVHNTVNAQNLKVYPPTSGTINGGSANTEVVVAGEETAFFFWVAANTWFGGVAVDF